jgi:AcrR family transcriptional regulator
MERARKAEDKERRAREILDAAEALSRHDGWAASTVAAVAARAGVAKGTVFLYFPTREALGLALLERELDRWVAELRGRLARARGDLTSTGVARVLTDTLKDRRLMIELLSILGSQLEANVDEATARGFKERLLGRVISAAEALETAVPGLGVGNGIRFLLQLDALVIGLWQMSSPAPVVARLLEEPHLRPLRVEFARELSLGLRALLDGLNER